MSTFLNTTITSFDIDQQTKEAESTLTQLENSIIDQIEQYVTQIESSLESTFSDIDDNLAYIANASTSLNQFVDEIQNNYQDINNYQDQVNQIDFLRWLITLCFVSIIGFFILITIIGLFFGLIFGACRAGKDDPTERSMISHVGSRFLQFSNIFYWIFTPGLMIITTLFFIIGGVGQTYFCVPLEPPEYELLGFAETVANNLTDGSISVKSSLEATNLDWVPESVLDDISLTSIIQDCSNDKSLYQVAKLEYVTEIQQAVTFLDQTIVQVANNVTEEIIEKLPLAIDEALTSTQLLDLLDNLTSNLEVVLDLTEPLRNSYYAGYNNALDLGLSNLENALQAEIDQLTQLADQLDSSSDPAELNVKPIVEDSISNLEIILANVATNMNQNLADWSFTVDQLEASTTDLNNIITTLINNLDALKNYLFIDDTFSNQSSQAIETQIEIILDLIIDFSKFVVTSTEYDLGKCENLYLIYEDLDQVLCDNIINVVNGSWLCLGWLAVSLPLAIYFSTKASNYFKRYRRTDDYQELDHYNFNPYK